MVKASDADLIAAVKNGKGKMPANNGKAYRHADQGGDSLRPHFAEIVTGQKRESGRTHPAR